MQCALNVFVKCEFDYGLFPNLNISFVKETKQMRLKMNIIVFPSSHKLSYTINKFMNEL